MTIALPVITIEILTLKKFLVELTESFLYGGFRENHNRKIMHTEITKKIVFVANIIHLLKMAVDISATPQEVMVMVEVEVPVVLSVTMDTNLIFLT